MGGADVAGGLLAADVLFAGAEREAQRGFAARILGHADDAAGHLSLELLARGKKSRVRSAVPERHAETLGAANGDVRAEFAGRREEGQREQVRGDGQQGAGSMGLFRKAGKIVDRAEGVRILHERPEDLVAE